MKKNSTMYNDEIDLIGIFKIIWDGKIKILLITIISFLVGFGYNFQIPNNYLNSLSINPSNSYELMQIEYIKKLIESNQLNRLNRSNESDQSSLDKFIFELQDFEEFLFYLKNTKKIQENISKLAIEDQEEELFRYAKLLKIDVPKKKEKNYTINFKWHDPEEAMKILQDTLNFTSNNLKIHITNELNRKLEFTKKTIINSDIERLDFLKEQNIIAGELNIENNQIDSVNLNQFSVPLSDDPADIAYYLRGSKAIEKEIENIQNRDYKRLKFIEQEINNLKDLEINFVNFNVYLMEIKSLKDTKFILTISVLLGLIIGVFFVLISNVVQSQTVSKKSR